ncbi:MAG: amidase [Pseudomonadota bacterium]
MTSAPEFLFWSAKQIATSIRHRELSALEVTDACLAQIERLNPQVNAVVTLEAEQARNKAIELDNQNKDRPSGALSGVPITIKDSIDTEGMLTTGGTEGRRNFVPDSDATVVKRLRHAGAIIIGKSNTPELTLSGETNNTLFGRTSNPFDLSLSPGGSSGGAAAAIACGFSYLDLGTDTGGSIREPAHYCGITGLKPTSGRTPLTGHIVPYGMGIYDGITQIGPMARSVEDLRTGISLISGADGIDYTIPPVSSAIETLDLSKQWKIGWYTDNGVVPTSTDIAETIRHTADRLSARGLDVQHAPLPGIAELSELTAEYRRADGGEMIHELLRRHNTSVPGPDLQTYLEHAPDTPCASVRAELFREIDRCRIQALEHMSQYDVILAPPSHTLARPHGSTSTDTFEDWSYVTFLNILGWPGAVVRAGTSQHQSLPIGVQIIGKPWSEHAVLSCAAIIEGLSGGFSAPQLAV